MWGGSSSWRRAEPTLEAFGGGLVEHHTHGSLESQRALGGQSPDPRIGIAPGSLRGLLERAGGAPVGASCALGRRCARLCEELEPTREPTEQRRGNLLVGTGGRQIEQTLRRGAGEGGARERGDGGRRGRRRGRNRGGRGAGGRRDAGGGRAARRRGC